MWMAQRVRSSAAKKVSRLGCIYYSIVCTIHILTYYIFTASVYCTCTIHTMRSCMGKYVCNVYVSTISYTLLLYTIPPTSILSRIILYIYSYNPHTHIYTIHIHTHSYMYTGTLDLTISCLRSCSKCHLQYLKNMGVVASMSIGRLTLLL